MHGNAQRMGDGDDLLRHLNVVAVFDNYTFAHITFRKITADHLNDVSPTPPADIASTRLDVSFGAN
jgi:hypothetical protein